MSDERANRTWPIWSTTPSKRALTPRTGVDPKPSTTPTTHRLRPPIGTPPIALRHHTAPRGRLRGTLLHRLLQRLVIPLAALLVVGWGFAGLPPVFPDSAVGPGMPTAAGARNHPTWDGTAQEVAATPAASPVDRRRDAGAGVAPPASSPVSTMLPPPAGASVSIPGSGTPTAPGAVGCVPPPAPPSPRQTALVTVEIANLREQPGLTCAVLREIPAETALTARSGIVRGDDVDWLLVETDGITGWVSARLVTPMTPATPTAASTTAAVTSTPSATASASRGVPTATACLPPPPPPPVPDRVPVVTTAAVNLRRGPGLGCDVITVLRAGAEVTLQSGPVRADGRLWVLITVEGTSGWVASDFLAEID